MTSTVTTPTTRVTRRGAALAAIVSQCFALLLAGSALACPNCGPKDERSQIAYLVATALLVAVPLSIVAVGGVWLVKLGRRESDPTGGRSR